MHTKSHLTPVSKRPSKAQTVQQLKFDTILVYLNNFLSLTDATWALFGDISNNGIQPLIATLPYKNYFGGGGDTGGGTTET